MKARRLKTVWNPREGQISRDRSNISYSILQRQQKEEENKAVKDSVENYCTYHLNYSKCRELKTICCIKVTYLEDSAAINTFKHKIYSCQRTRGSTAFREHPGRKDETLTAQATGDTPGASASPAQLPPEATSCPGKQRSILKRRGKYFHQWMSL